MPTVWLLTFLSAGYGACVIVCSRSGKSATPNREIALKAGSPFPCVIRVLFIDNDLAKNVITFVFTFLFIQTQDESFSHLCEVALEGMEMLDSLATFADINKKVW